MKKYEENFYRLVVKKKKITMNRLEDELVENLTNEFEIEELIEESTEFELYADEKLVLIEEMLEKQFSDINTEVVTKNKSTESHAVNLPKLEIKKFSGEYTKWQTFMDSFTAAVDSARNLSHVEKFNYLRCYLTGDALHTIEGLSLTNDNYEKAIGLLKERYGNTQAIITAHMNELLSLKKVESDRDLIGIRKLYDNTESHVRSLNSLGIQGEHYGSLLTPIIMERLPHEFRLNVSRNLKDELWDLTKLLTLIHDEIRARENCTVPNTATTKGGKNNLFSSKSDELPFTGASLFSAGHKQAQNSCVFCRKPHWSDKCTVITDCEAHKEFLRKGGRCFLCLKPNHMMKNCNKSKPCFIVRVCTTLQFVHNEKD